MRELIFVIFARKDLMARMKILIVEDEPFAAEELKEKLETLDHEVTGIAESYEEALELIRTNKPELVLVDIELKGELTGIDLSEELNRQNILFIYISSIDDLSVYYKAKTTGPVEYLPKPVNSLSLRNALLELEAEITTLKNKRMHFFHDKNGIKKRIEPDQIVYLQAGGMYCQVYFVDGTTPWMLSVPMGNVIRDLDHPDLIQIHRSYAVNRNYVENIQASKVQMIVGPFLPISKPYKENLFRFVNKI
jgi:DNA-binding LytR/AlgR family response regulator